MFKLDDNLLRELGLGSLPAAEKNRMLSHIYETLEMRVGMKLAQRMTNEQLDEFEAFIDRSDEAGALKWLESNFPNYKQVVAEELDALKAEIKVAAPQIVAASQQSAATVPVDQGAQMQQPQPQQPLQPIAPGPLEPASFVQQPYQQQAAPQVDQFSQPPAVGQFGAASPQPLQPQPSQPIQMTPQPYQGQFPAPPATPGIPQDPQVFAQGQASPQPPSGPQYPPAA